ncbi:BMC domain-containing protein [Brevibacterium linens]|uniref:BMC domain-containing protein n=1 Tax=Brevibacterium linens TaxID=1703 RepID=UPI003BF51D31
MTDQSNFSLRAFVQIDRLQPQFAAYNGATVLGSVPISGDSILVGELGPGNEVFRIVDVALKAARVEASSQIVEREFGFFMLRSQVNSEILAARDAILGHISLSIDDRIAPVLESEQVITSVEPYQAQLLNKWRKGSLVVPGETMGIIECSPAAYITAAANEAEKHASIKIVEVRAVGRFGRLFITGSEGEVRTGVEAASELLKTTEGR